MLTTSSFHLLVCRLLSWMHQQDSVKKNDYGLRMEINGPPHRNPLNDYYHEKSTVADKISFRIPTVTHCSFGSTKLCSNTPQLVHNIDFSHLYLTQHCFKYVFLKVWTFLWLNWAINDERYNCRWAKSVLFHPHFFPVSIQKRIAFVHLVSPSIFFCLLIKSAHFWRRLNLSIFSAFPIFVFKLELILDFIKTKTKLRYSIAFIKFKVWMKKSGDSSASYVFAVYIEIEKKNFSR